MTSSQVFVGLAVTLALAVARHVVAGRARAPAIILLLPVGLAVAGRISAMSPQIAVMLGAILIVSGPTVVGPILESAATGPGLVRLAGPLAAEVILATVLTVAGLCDAVAPDTGLVAAIVMGMTVAGVSGADVPQDRSQLTTVVQLTIGLLFVSISATVTPTFLVGAKVPSTILVALLVLIVGIVAASTAASFGPPLAALGWPARTSSWRPRSW